ncbi:MAPEG family protein [Enterovibrio paralichthyis]|uniref:MAPEG family protein n=1 Tax=Enterovibrio paralichthyis TaxID=2853805 RepID=UPI001C475F37|nr:MAPEG family protein [Enterovibrio paralichthyis]MBV7297504.1 MAPEG family protein [Enterovibrio paralichthyis]
MENLTIAPVLIAVCIAIQIPATLAVGLRRLATGINFGWGDDTALMKKVRGHGNFTETVPITLLAITLAEYLGMAQSWVLAAAIAIVAGRLIHYHTLVFTRSGATNGRPVGMILTFSAMVIPSVYLLYQSF